MDAGKTGAKTRALKKYEAAPLVRAADAKAPRLDLVTPFGPAIGKTETPTDLVERLNRHCDIQIGEAQLRAQAGCEFLLPPALAREGGEASLAHHIETLIRRYLAGVEDNSPTRVVIDVIWVVSQYAGTPSPVHFHTGDISGVLYLKTPSLHREDEEERKTYISGRQAGYINFLIGGKQRFSKSLISFKPKIGDFYVFPGWLLHGAEPFRGDGERRSLAFNAFVEGGDR